jgi:hypothetical protein
MLGRRDNQQQIFSLSDLRMADDRPVVPKRLKVPDLSSLVASDRRRMLTHRTEKMMAAVATAMENGDEIRNYLNACVLQKELVGGMEDVNDEDAD